MCKFALSVLLGVLSACGDSDETRGVVGPERPPLAEALVGSWWSTDVDYEVVRSESGKLGWKVRELERQRERLTFGPLNGRGIGEYQYQEYQWPAPSGPPPEDNIIEAFYHPPPDSPDEEVAVASKNPRFDDWGGQWSLEGNTLFLIWRNNQEGKEWPVVWGFPKTLVLGDLLRIYDPAESAAAGSDRFRYYEREGSAE